MHFCALFETPAKVGLRIVMAVQVQTVAHSNVNQQGGTSRFLLLCRDRIQSSFNCKIEFNLPLQEKRHSASHISAVDHTH